MGIKYSIEEYRKDIDILRHAILKSGTRYDLIVGIQRGGLIPAVHLSNILDIPMASIQWSHKGIREEESPILLNNRERNILLIDDILDRGDTLHYIQKHYWKMDTAVLIYNFINQYSIVPNFCAQTINRNDTPDWFDFWWETV